MMDDKAILTLFSPTISRECTSDGLKRLTKLVLIKDEKIQI